MSTPRSLRWADGITSEAISSSVGEIAILRCDPTAASRGSVVLVHGFGGSKEDFAVLLPSLASRGWQAIAIDLPGQHESTLGGTRPSIDTAIAGVRDVLATTAGDSADVTAAHLVGHSLGGLISRDVVLDADVTAVSTLTLLCSGPSALNEPVARESLERFRIAMADGQIDLVWEHLANELAPGTEADVAAWVERRFRSGDPAMHAALAEHLLNAPDRIDELSDHPVPVHVAYGVDDDVWPLEDQDLMAKRLGANLSRIHGAGHSPAIDDPEATATTLDLWWTAGAQQ